MISLGSNGRLIVRIVAPFLMLLAWGVYSAHFSSAYFPPLTRILDAFASAWFSMRIVTDVLPSLGRLLAGYAIGCLVGAIIGVLLGISPRLRGAFEPVVHFLRSIPPPAMLPFGMLVLGVGDLMKILIIAFICLWPVVLGAIDGIRGVDPLQVDTARVYRIPRRDILWRVQLPAAAPQIFAGMRISLALAIILMVISEMVSSTNGVGFFIIQAQSNFAIPQMWAGILMLGLFGFCLNAVFNAVEVHALKWHRGAKGNEGN